MTPPELQFQPTLFDDDSAETLQIIREHERHAGPQIRCELGEVLDLSEAGLRVRGQTRPKGPLTIQLYAMDWTLNVRCRVVWTEASAQFRFESGLAFIDLTGRQVRELRSMARRRARFL